MTLFRVNNLFQALKQSARLAWQSFFQPSKAFDFLNESERNKYIYIWHFVVTGFTIGILLSIPYYLIYTNLIQSILLAFACAAPLVVASLVAFKRAVASKTEFAFESALTVTGAVVFVFAGVFAVAIASENAGAFAAAAAVVGAVAVAVVISALRASTYLYSFTFMGLTLILLSTVRGIITRIEIYETVIYPLIFLAGYILVSSFAFQKDNSNFKEGSRDKLLIDIDIPRLKFAKAQKLSLLWGPLFALLMCIPIYSQWEPNFHSKLFITAVGFAILPIFILRIPDYLIGLPIWFYQRRKLLGTPNNRQEIMAVYHNSLLFKHEMIYLQLPGLHKIMAVFAGNKEIGLKEALRQIDHLNRFTFQQKQARKSIITLGKYNETAHLYIHFLLENNDLSRLKSLSQKSPLAKLYLMLFEEKDNNKADKPDDIRLVSREMEKNKSYRFNAEMIHILETLHRFLKAASLKDFYEGCGLLEKVMNFPAEINYFTHLQQVNSHLEKIKNDLVKIEEVELFDTRRSFLNGQKEAFSDLLKTTKENFYEPFQTIWQRVLQHCTELMEKEIKRLQNSAVLDVRLKNKEIFTSNENQYLYFNIRNKGQGHASNISITLQEESQGIASDSKAVKDIPVIEAGKKKDVALPIKAPSHVETVIKGTLTFSDRTRENKSIPFSFPITVLKRSSRFKKIDNPYVVGQPLTGDAPLFFGRGDAYRFIDENITTSGGERHIIVCHGLRRTGKTSLLYRIETHGLSDRRLVPIFFDIQGIDDEKHFYYKLSRAILGKLLLPPVAGIESFNLFEQSLEKIKQKLGPRILLLMMDEFEELQQRVEEKKISKSIFGHIRHLMQHEQKLAFLFCGTHNLEEMSHDYWSIFFNTTIHYRISHLKREDAEQLIKEPVKGQLTYDGMALDQILKMTYGQPFLTQKICHTIIRDLNENKKRNYAVINDVDDAVEQIISGGDEHFSQNLWKDCKKMERLILSAVAEDLTDKQPDRMAMNDIYNRICEVLPGQYSSEEVEKSMGKLVSQEILCKAENGYYFPVNLLRKWIALRFPLRKFRPPDSKDFKVIPKPQFAK